MLCLITGGSGSGKSEYGESVALKLYEKSKNRGKLYYVATMIPMDSESLKRIERHREMRKDKGFCTVECFCEIEKLKFNKNDTVIIECMSNLIANEMYSKEGRIKGDDIIEKAESAVVSDVKSISEQAGNVVIITNEVFSDCNCYDEESIKYLNIMGYVNRRIVEISQYAVEVVCGIPVKIKEIEGGCNV